MQNQPKKIIIKNRKKKFLSEVTTRKHLFVLGGTGCGIIFYNITYIVLFFHTKNVLLYFNKMFVTS